MSTIKISELIAQPHLKHFNSKKRHQLDHGGRAGYKSSKNAIKLALGLLNDPTAELVVAREDYSDHFDTTYADLKWAFMMLGCPLVEGVHYPRGKDIHIKLPQGNYVHFKQMKEIDKVKGVRRHNPNNKIKYIWYFEITQFKHKKQGITDVNASYMRGNPDYFMCLYEWNDHAKLGNWTYDFMYEMQKRPDAYVKKTNYNDAPIWQQEKFLGKILLQEIHIIKQTSPETYKNTYLGLPANLEGTFFKTFNRAIHAKPASKFYSKIVVGVDFGGNDATTAIARGIIKNYQGMEMFKQYYHKNGVSVGMKTINDYRDDILEFCEKLFNEYKMVIDMYIDSANNTTLGMLLKEQIAIKYRYINMLPLPKMKKRKGTKKEKLVIQERGDVTNIIFGANYCTIDPNECPQLVKALESAEYNNKGVLADDGRSDIDSVDAFWYSWLADMDIVYDMIVRGAYK
jgi:PBSX family phage terminase large subunit